MMMPQFCKFTDFNKKHKNLGIIFASNKKFINYTQRATLWQKQFCRGGNISGHCDGTLKICCSFLTSQAKILMIVQNHSYFHIVSSQN